jgi:hypothetical protein
MFVTHSSPAIVWVWNLAQRRVGKVRWEVWLMVLLPGVADGGASCDVEFSDVGLRLSTSTSLGSCREICTDL